MNRILKSQKRLKKCKTNRFAAWLLAVLMLFSALPTGSITVHAETETTDVAKIGETPYTSLEDAIEAAVSGNTIQLIANTEITEITESSLSNGITLDLNGYTLSASCIYAVEGMHVIDSSSDKTGILKVPDDKFMLSSSNSQMPVYNVEKDGYVFADIEDIVHQEHVIDTAAADTYEFIFKPYFGDTINKLLKNGGDTAEVDFGIRLKWGTIERDLTYEDDIVKQVYTEDRGLAFYVKLIGVNKFEGLTITPFIKSERGTVCLGNEYPATLVTGDDTGAWTEGDTTYESLKKGYYFKDAGVEEGFGFGGGAKHTATRDLLIVTGGGGTDAASIWSPKTLNIATADADTIRIRINTDVEHPEMTLNVKYVNTKDGTSKWFKKEISYAMDDTGWAIITVDLSDLLYHAAGYVIAEFGIYPLGEEEDTAKTGTVYIDYIEVLKKAGSDTDGGNTDEEVLSGYYFTANSESWAFGYDETIGWPWVQGGTDVWENDALRRSAKLAGGKFWSPTLNVDAAKADYVLLRVKVDGATKGSTVIVQVNVVDGETSVWKPYSVQLTEDILATDGYYEVKLDLTEVNSGTISKIGITQWYDETTGAAGTQTFYMDSCEIWSTADSDSDSDTDGGNTDEEVLSGYYFTANSESWAFGYDETIGWPWVQGGTDVWENDALRRSAKLAGGKFWSPTLNVDAAKADYVLLRVKVGGATEGSTVIVQVHVVDGETPGWKSYSVQLTENILAEGGYYEVKLDLTGINTGTIKQIGITQWYDATEGAETTQTFYMDSCEIWGTADSE